jgi:hypothetical protein
VRTTTFIPIISSAEARLFPLRVRLADGPIWQVGGDPPVVLATPASCKARRKKKKVLPTQQTRSAVRSRWSLAALLLGLLLNRQPCKSHRRGARGVTAYTVHSRATVGTY